MKKTALISIIVVSVLALSACTSNTANKNTSTSSGKKEAATKSTNNTNTSNKTSDSKLKSPSISENSNGDYIITDVSSWSHPAKTIFNREGIKINKVVLKDNKTYPVFYVTLNKDLNSSNKDYYTKLMKDIALANGYWDYEIIDESRGADIKVTCKDKKYVDKISYNKDANYFTEESTQSLSKEQQLVNYLINNVSEVKSFVNVHANSTVSKASVYVERYPNAASSNQYERDYYIIYVGESYPDHAVNTYRFAVNSAMTQILYYDTANDKYETLSDWRSQSK
ncbi:MULTISPECIES: hypothetical protein [Clostridium]|uniref:hypothetical protein n=1 Tax=Clostridium TaxID=1485 RepID=UPI0008254EC7|nr:MULTISPECIES: hypothetical protein [Clostridium]PJI08140.1 hypothetical protein CUB90_09800 [Clostridium sp. CT7]